MKQVRMPSAQISLSDADVLARLDEAFSGRLITDAAEMAPFLTDWRKAWTGKALAVVQPDTVQDVAKVMAWACANRISVTPQGGNTGLAGGSQPSPHGRNIVLSTARLNRVRHVDIQNNTITVEAGVILQTLQQAAADAGRLFPLSLAAEGSCTIGGNLATNAGGVAVLRYGNTRELCLGLELVTPDGQIWDGLRGLRKDNTGYDLRDLYIGSEGTLGIITAAVMKLYPAPAAKVAAFVGLESAEQATGLLQLAQARAGSTLTAFELISNRALALVQKHFPANRSPFAASHPWNVLLEISAPVSEAEGRAALEALLEAALEQDLAADAVVAGSLAQSAALWALRERISESQSAEGASIKHDISVPISKIAGFIPQGEAAILAIAPGARLVAFGHLGDGNLHYNISFPEGGDGEAFMALRPRINLVIHDLVAAHGGSISAEHGLGLLRRDEAARYRPAVETALMQAVKQALDPLGLMNPGKVLPPA
jgi:FAD/FMN-containing dehydrogenase